MEFGYSIRQMFASRLLLWVRRTLVVAQLLLLVVPAGLAAASSSAHCRCGMERGHCICSLIRARSAGHCGMKGAIPDSCSLRPVEPLEGRTSSPASDLRDRLGVCPGGELALEPTPGGTVARLVVRPPASFTASPDTPPPRPAFRIG